MVRKALDIVKTALRGVGGKFFHVRTSYAAQGIVRERVFCYELYYQMRRRRLAFPLSLHGEIDKRGHLGFQHKDRRNPDFILHRAGSDLDNLLVIEVKGRLTPFDGVFKDFETLTTFVRTYQYQGGVFVLYNHSFERLRRAASRNRHAWDLGQLAQLPEAEHIYILAIPAGGEDVTEHRFSDLRG